jgi:hypothetical protein
VSFVDPFGLFGFEDIGDWIWDFLIGDAINTCINDPTSLACGIEVVLSLPSFKPLKGCKIFLGMTNGSSDIWKGLIKATAEARQKVKPGMLKDFSSSEVGRSSGHARAKHGWRVNDPKIIDIRNNPDKIYVGVNENGNKVVVFWKDGDVVITDAADTTSVITAYGRSAPKNASYQRDKWTSNSNFGEVAPTNSQCGCSLF